MVVKTTNYIVYHFNWWVNPSVIYWFDSSL